MTFLEPFDKLLPRFHGFRLTFRLVSEEVVDLRHGSIESTNGKAMVCNIHNQVLSHDSKAYKAHITSRTIQNTRWLADINADQSGAGVSKEPCSDEFFFGILGRKCMK